MEQIRRVGMYRESPGSDIVKQGYLKKLKTGHLSCYCSGRLSCYSFRTMKKKFFVLRATSSSGPARLDYFDSEKKFKTSHPPKKSYQLHTIFNINKKIDSKHKHGIAVFLPAECFSALAESQDEQEDWINKMLEYQNEYLPQDEEPRVHYDYVWQGVIKHKSPNSCPKISGAYRLCLSEKAVSLVKLSEYKPSYQFQFSSIRKCGAHEHLFMMEVGRSAVTGVGEIWLEVEGSHAAQNMHDVILSEMAASRAAEDPFRRRSNTSTSAISHSGETYKRKRATSESHHHHPPGSPRKNRALYAQQRPQSTVVYSTYSQPRNSQLAIDSQIPLGSSPSAFDPSFLDEPRMRSDSMGSRSSRCSRISDVLDHPYENTNPNTPVISPEGSFVSARSMTPEASQSITEEDLSETEPYLPMTPAHRSVTPSPTRSQVERGGDYLPMVPGQPEKSQNDYLPMNPGQDERTDDYLSMTPGQSMTPGHRSGSPSPTIFGEKFGSNSQTGGGYMDMRPGSGAVASSQESYMNMTPPKSSSGSGGYMDMTPTTPPVHSNNGYIDMNPGQRTPTDPGPGYVMMDGAWVRTTAPIPIRVNKEPGYMDMGPSSQPLPTVKESGSGEAYLPMSPSGQGIISSEGLKPVKVISYLSDDSMSGELPKRAYSVGSRPISKPTLRYRQPQEILRHQPLDSSKSSSAPHLIVQKSRSQFMDSGHRNHHDGYIASPLSQSVKSDDSDSFAEMEFYRPRTASDSYGCRPRSSSFGKQLMPQGHRPRSSSYGQGAKGTMSKLAAGFRQDSFDSVRTTSQELSSKRSQESLGILSSSSRNSSSDSLKKLSDGSHSKKGSENGEYMDMNYDKCKTPSPNVQGVVSPKKDTTGYMDMSLGSAVSKSLSRGMSPCSSTHSLPSSSTHSLGSSPASVGHGHSHTDRSQGAKVITPSGKVISQKHTYKAPAPVSSENQLKVVTSRLKKGDKRSPSSSGKESEDESYVPFQPSQTVSSSSYDDSSSILHMKNPYEFMPKSHPGLKIQHGYSKSHDSGVRSPESSATKLTVNPEKTKGKKESKTKTEEQINKSKLKREKDIKNKEKSSPKFDRQKSYTLKEEQVVSGQSPTIERTLAFMPDDDIFSNKMFKSNGSQVKSSVTTLSDTFGKKPDDSSYMEYLPGFEESVDKTKGPVKASPSKQFIHREYCEIDFPDKLESSEKTKETRAVSGYMECDPAILKQSVSSESSPAKEKCIGSVKHNESGSFKDKKKDSTSQPDSSIVKESRKELNDDFSYIDFDPVTERKVENEKQKQESVMSPQRVLSFLAHSLSVEEKVDKESDMTKGSHEAFIGVDEKKLTECDQECKVENVWIKQTVENTRPFLDKTEIRKWENVASIKGESCSEGPAVPTEKEVSQLCQNVNASKKGERSVLGGNKENEIENDNKTVDIDKDGEDEEFKKQGVRERQLGKLIIKQVGPPLLEGEMVQDEGYCDLDFSSEKEVFPDKSHTRSESASSSNSDKSRKKLESIGSEDSIPCPETPISYISEEGDDIPVPETPLSYISDDSTSGSSVGSKEFGSPFKSPLAGRASNPTMGKVAGFGLASFGVGGESLRKSLPTPRSYGGIQQNTALSRQSSVPVGPSAISPRSSTDMQHAYRSRKASGPACLSTQTKQGNGASGNRLSSQGCLEPVAAGLELHKQKSMPCMIVPQNLDKIKDIETLDHVQSRHSFTDLSSYEEMNFPASSLSAGNQIKCSSQQQLTSDSGSNELHYADLDLKGSTENMDSTSPRVVKSRHPSSMDDVSKENVPYAEIDHLKTEKMKNLNDKDKDVKFYVN
ncbi:insulin receptor substrate 1-B-like isoform X2 [Mercenaria mercenaria]|uniref:insulin receptor substrate 1-B-like isoform X2 n=1 Tax=Mercenaria mercenaria TaxID=6596 RepID=UPI00234F24DB|nr:insulin receptor substrate 1-B-like isoform X2 [Mercenaria mercenaria]